MKQFTPLAAATAACALAACVVLPAEPIGAAAPEKLFAVTTSNRLISFNGGQPQKLLSDAPLKGLQPQEQVLGIDYRVARGQLFALGSSGRLYRIDTPTATASAVGGPLAVPLQGSSFGFDFNPTVDRIRVVGNTGQNLRLHPDTGAVVDSDANTTGVQTDGRLAYDAADTHAGRTAAVVGAGYTYNSRDDKITTNFAIDAGQRTLVTQGSREGVQPVVSPNTGRLFTVGALGVDAFAQASFDISDVRNTAYAALTFTGAKGSVLHRVDLATGRATRIGTINIGEPVAGIAIEP